MVKFPLDKSERQLRSQLVPIIFVRRATLHLIIFNRSSTLLSPSFFIDFCSPLLRYALVLDFTPFPVHITNLSLRQESSGKQCLYPARYVRIRSPLHSCRHFQVAYLRYFGQQLRLSKSLNETLERRTQGPPLKLPSLFIDQQTRNSRLGRSIYLKRFHRRGEMRRREKGIDRVKRDTP